MASPYVLADFIMEKDGSVVHIPTGEVIIDPYEFSVGRNEMRQTTNGVADEEAARMGSRAEIIRAEMDRLQEELYKLEQYGEDDFDSGSVITWTMKFQGSDIDYTYAAVKSPPSRGGKWFTTGTFPDQKMMTWDELKNFWARHEMVAEPRFMTKWKAIAGR